MKYYIQFPISFNCNLRCTYCFQEDFFNYVDSGIIKDDQKWLTERPFTLDDYRDWRNINLTDATEIVTHLFGGEPFCEENVEDVFSIIDFMDKEKIDLLSNGICDSSIIKRLEKYKDKIHRIGFTYHRRIMDKNPALIKQYEENVLLAKSFGLNVYVKELLLIEYKDKLLNYKKFWKSKNIDFKIQDFKGEGFDNGPVGSGQNFNQYTPIDILLVDYEYKHQKICSCKHDYKNIIIRGFDLDAGDIIACWFDTCVIGNILDKTYEKDYIISTNKKGSRDILISNKFYRQSNDPTIPK